MAGGNGEGEEQLKKMAELSKTLKEGERILAPTRRPDGTLRKPIRIRAGYVPQDEVAIYQSKGTLWKKEMASNVGPPGYEPPPADAKPKTKSVKRNERKKEKRLQAALEKDKTSEQATTGEVRKEAELDSDHGAESVHSVTSQMNDLAVSVNPSVSENPDQTESSNLGNPVQDIDKRIRAIKKKIRLTEAQLQKASDQDLKPEQLDKFCKLDDWRKELKLLEDSKAKVAS